MAALSKGWSIFSSAVVGASRVVSENIIQPGLEKVTDPNFQAGVKGYVAEAGKRAGEVGMTANMWTKHTLGVDVVEGVGGVVGTVKDTIGGGPGRRGYGQVNQDYVGETSALYHDHEEDDFFNQNSPSATDQQTGSLASASSATAFRPNSTTAKKGDDWDEWKDF